jgi:hypothetical protein
MLGRALLGRAWVGRALLGQAEGEGKVGPSCGFVFLFQ